MIHIHNAGWLGHRRSKRRKAFERRMGRAQARRYARGILLHHVEGPFALDAERAQRVYGWTNAECWALVNHAVKIMRRANARRKKRKERAR